MIKIIAVIVCICFLWQEIGWAGDYLRQRQSVEVGLTLTSPQVSEVVSNGYGKSIRHVYDGYYGFESGRGQRKLYPKSPHLKPLILFPSQSPRLSGLINTPRIINMIILITIIILTLNGNLIKSAATNAASNILPQSNRVWETASRLPSDNTFILVIIIITLLFTVKTIL